MLRERTITVLVLLCVCILAARMLSTETLAYEGEIESSSPIGMPSFGAKGMPTK